MEKKGVFVKHTESASNEMKYVLVTQILFTILVTIVFISEHGGVSGDYVYLPGRHIDTTTDQANLGQTILNRWRVNVSREPLIVRCFIYINLPSFVMTRLIVEFFGTFVDEMNRPFPFGISYTSYIALPAMPISILQWYCIVYLFRRLLSRTH